MAKFARDCLDKLPTVIHELQDKLGEETAALQLRVGLHSGPVTAGELLRSFVRSLSLIIVQVCFAVRSQGSNSSATRSTQQLVWKAMAYRDVFRFRRLLQML